MGRKKNAFVMPRCTHPDGCVQPRTPFKGSPFCQYHTCEDYQCKNATEYGMSLCNKHLCEHPSCSKKKMSDTTACYSHICSRCRKQTAVIHRDDEKRQFCPCCDRQCRALGCQQPRCLPLKFCPRHKCEVDGCTQIAPDGGGYCRQSHGCRLCSRRATENQLCIECAKTCNILSCPAHRPPDHDSPKFFCSAHGCHECHADIFAYGFLRRSPWKSCLCKNHVLCGTPNCPFPRLSDDHVFCEYCKKGQDKQSTIASSIWRACCDHHNKTINKRNAAETYHLMCQEYCSYGYCTCDLMPRLDYNTFTKPLVHARGKSDEPVILVSPAVRTTDGDATKAAWTLPLVSLQYDDHNYDYLLSMIRFEDVHLLSNPL